MEKKIQIAGKAIQVAFIQASLISEKRPILVFLHEALGSIQQWKSFPNLLCDRLNLPGLIIERSGHGQSSALVGERNQHYLHEYAEETNHVLNEILPLHHQYILVGHSDGGSIALIHAAQQPKSCLGIVTMAAHTFVEKETIDGIAPAIEAFEAGKLNGLFAIHGEKTAPLFYAWANTWRAPFFQNWDIRTTITSISIPVLAIQGKRDQYGTKAQLNSIEKIGNHVTIIELSNCGHHPHLEMTMEVILDIENWIKKHFQFTNFH